MMDTKSMDNLATEIASMDRGSLIHRLRTMRCNFPLDFTDDFLNAVSLDRLRHIALAAGLHELKAA